MFYVLCVTSIQHQNAQPKRLRQNIYLCHKRYCLGASSTVSKVESGVVFWKLQVRPQSQVMPFYSKIILAYGIKGVVRLFVPSLFFFFLKKNQLTFWRILQWLNIFWPLQRIHFPFCFIDDVGLMRKKCLSRLNLNWWLLQCNNFKISLTYIIYVLFSDEISCELYFQPIKFEFFILPFKHEDFIVNFFIFLVYKKTTLSLIFLI